MTSPPQPKFGQSNPGDQTNAVISLQALSYVQSFGDRGYVSLFANALTARNGGGAYPHSGTGHLVC